MNNILIVIVVIIVIILCFMLFRSNENFGSIAPLRYGNEDRQVELDLVYEQVLDNLNRYIYSSPGFDSNRNLRLLRSSLNNLKDRYTEVVDDLNSCQSRNVNLERQLQTCRRQLANRPRNIGRPPSRDDRGGRGGRDDDD